MLNNPDDTYRILIIEDNLDTTEIVKRALQRANFQISSAASGELGLQQIARHGLPHLALVDLNLPGMNGFEFCEAVHKFSDLPIILLTAIDNEETIIEGIEHYAEDYITKPFSPRVLVARIQRVLRRIGDFDYTLEPLTKIDDRLSIDFANQEAVVVGEKVSLTPTETKLLYILMRSPGRIVTTDFLISRLWPFEDAYEDRLRVHVHRLRHKIESKESKATYIYSERGMGYRFQSKTAAPQKG